MVTDIANFEKHVESFCSHTLSFYPNLVKYRFYNIYTQTKVKQRHVFFGDTVLEVAERNMWVMEIKYFEFY